MSNTTFENQFAQDVKAGFSAHAKYLSSKYLYDDEGSRIFQEIMNLEEYYPTDCEYEILSQKQEEMLQFFCSGKNSFELLEFGAGDGLKTKLLLNHFVQRNIDFSYVPIDISEDAVRGLVDDLESQLPKLKVRGVVDDYFGALQAMEKRHDIRRIVLFLGGNIGNFDQAYAHQFLQELRKNLTPEDQVLIGFDLKKDPHVVIRAYNDAKGVTRRFNMNLLERMNRELGANFKVRDFMHYPVYDPASGAAKSYIMSKKKQEVFIEALDESFLFEAWEAIHTENSFKYTPYMINELAQECGFEVMYNFMDSRNYFSDSLWQVPAS